jgi:hypothetical protein
MSVLSPLGMLLARDSLTERTTCHSQLLPPFVKPNKYLTASTNTISTRADLLIYSIQ